MDAEFAPGDGVGGYECLAGSGLCLMVSIEDLLELDDGEAALVDNDAAEIGREPRLTGFVLEVNDRAASAWNGDEVGTTVNGMDTPGGNEGARILMYHPRFGLCIVQQTFEVAFS